MAKIAIVFYSLYGHIRKLAEAEKAGIERAGGTVDLYQIAETLPREVLDVLHAPPQPTDIPVLKDPAVLATYDGFLMGIPTRYGNFPSQWRAFWDTTGPLWMQGAFHGKFAGLFVSTSSQGGGQEGTAIAALSTLAHHGIHFVPLGFARTMTQMKSFEEIHGGSAWGAGTFAGDGSRQPTALELDVATIQGEEFYKTVAKQFGA